MKSLKTLSPSSRQLPKSRSKKDFQPNPAAPCACQPGRKVIFAGRQLDRFSCLAAFKNEAFWVLAALALWLLAMIPDLRIRLSGFFLFGFYLCLRFEFRRLFLVSLWLILALFLEGSLVMHQAGLQKPQEGEYTVTLLKARYGLAASTESQVVFYEPEGIALGDRLHLSDFEEVHTLNNPGLFSFQNYLASQQTIYSAGTKQVLPSTRFSLRRSIWNFIASRQASSLYKMLFYGISENENLEWLSSIGLPLIALCGVIKTRLSRYCSKEKAGWTISFIQLLILVLFPASQAVKRVFVFGLAANLFKSWPARWGISVLSFLLLEPGSASSLTLVLPAGLSFLCRFAAEGWQKKIVQILWCAFCQILWMGKLNILYLAIFLQMRTLLGWFFMASLPGLWLESWGMILETLLNKASFSLDWCTIYGHPPFWYACAAGILVLLLAWKWKRSRMILAVSVFCIYPFVWNLDPFFHVYQLDVGQGDAAVIVEPFKKSAVMIDAAGRFNHDNAKELFIPFLQSRQIHHLDFLVISHGDFDHDGAAQAMNAYFPVRETIREGVEKLAVGYDFHFLLPQRKADPGDENDQSQICLFGYDGFHFLYTGDASVHIEKQLLEQYDVKADILKLGHHGSDTSSCREFLKAVNPQLGLISSGYKNRYGHPKASVLQTMDELGIDRLNTADHGAIHLMSLPQIMIIQSADGLTALLSG